MAATIVFFDDSKTLTVNFGEQQFSLTNIHDNRAWSAKEGFFEGLMSCAEIFAIPECKWWGLIAGSKILPNGSLEIEITIGFSDSRDIKCPTESRKCCILPEFVSVLSK